MTAESIVNTRGALRLSVLEAVRAEADPLFAAHTVPLELDGDGLVSEFISRGQLGEALERVKRSDLPPIDVGSAEVKTPAEVFVDAICPECNLPTRILVILSTVLETTREAGSTIKLKAKAKGRTHVHHQLALEVDEAQTELGLDQGEELDAEDEGLLPDEDTADLRPTGEVNADELRGEAARSVVDDGLDDDDALLPA